jgi:hypothetical protein
MSDPREEPLLVDTDEDGEAIWAIWTSEGYIPQEEFRGCKTVSTEIGTGKYTDVLCAFLEAVDLDAGAQWVVMADGSLVATQSIDHPLYDGQPGWQAETVLLHGVGLDHHVNEGPEVVLVEAPKGQTLEEWQEEMAELRRRAREAIDEHEA